MQNVYTVAQVNSYIKNMFTQDFMMNRISVKGEVSNCKYHSTGHIYYTLKDQKGAISCVMFAGSRKGLSFSLENGQQVVAEGSITVYERDGKYQLYTERISLDGAGLLYERFEQLKKMLEEMGMFAQEYKRPIPPYIKTLGVVTARTGAAIQDIINITRRRNPCVQIIVYPAIVQGESAAASIINGIHALEAKGVDLMIVGRGGGSIEDLWAFNEEAVAHAIFECNVPIISAVGHEIDFTIADFVADLRAPTPSAAAELAVYEIDAFYQKLSAYENGLVRGIHHKIEKVKTRYHNLQLQLRHKSPKSQIREKRTRVISMEEQLQKAMEQVITEKKHKLAIYIERLRGLSPLDKLKQGFSYVESAENQVINSVDKVSVGELLYIHVKNGMITGSVVAKKRTRRTIADE